MAKRWKKHERRRFADRAVTEGTHKIADEAQVRPDTVSRWMTEFDSHQRKNRQSQSSAANISGAAQVAQSASRQTASDDWKTDNEVQRTIDELVEDTLLFVEDSRSAGDSSSHPPQDVDLATSRELIQAIWAAGEDPNDSDSPYARHLKDQLNRWAHTTAEQHYELHQEDFPEAPRSYRDASKWEAEVLNHATDMLAEHRMRQVAGHGSEHPSGSDVFTFMAISNDSERAAMEFAQAAIETADFVIEEGTHMGHNGETQPADVELLKAKTLWSSILEAGDASAYDSPYMEQLGDSLYEWADQALDGYYAQYGDDDSVQMPDVSHVPAAAGVGQDELDEYISSTAADAIAERRWRKVVGFDS